MNIGDTVKLIKKEYPSVTISRIRFLEKEGLLKPKRSKGGTRSFTEKGRTTNQENLRLTRKSILFVESYKE